MVDSCTVFQKSRVGVGESEGFLEFLFTNFKFSKYFEKKLKTNFGFLPILISK